MTLRVRLALVDDVVLAGNLPVGVAVADGMRVDLVFPVEHPGEAGFGVGHGPSDGEGGAEGRGSGRGLVEAAGLDGVSGGDSLF